MRSPMWIKNDLSATAGNASTRSTAALKLTCSRGHAGGANGSVAARRVIFGGLPNSTSIGIATGSPPSAVSRTTSSRFCVSSPITANGQRSRSLKRAKRSTSRASIASM